MLNVFVTDEEEAALKAAGYKIGAHDRGLQHRPDPHGAAPGRSSTRRPSPPTSPRTACPRARKFEGKSVVPTPGDTVIQRANTFTDVVGPSGGTTTARFLYVEAFNKSTKVTGTTGLRPDPGALLRGR